MDNYLISNRSNPVYKTLATYRGQMWGHLPLIDECFDFFESIKKYVQPKKILETGFNMGYSSSIQLEVFPEAHISSYDKALWNICSNMATDNLIKHGFREPEKLACADLMKLLYGERFQFYHQSTKGDTISTNHKLEPPFDYMFIDGDHTEIGCANDIEQSFKLKIPYIAIDNMEQDTVLRAVMKFSDKLEFLEEKEYYSYHATKNLTIYSTLHFYKTLL